MFTRLLPLRQRLRVASRRKQRNRQLQSLVGQPLEPRCVLAAITVTSLADTVIDDGQVTLREAILAAETNSSIDGSVAGDSDQADVIEFDASIAGGTIDLVNFVDGAALAINSQLTIEGAGVTLQRSSSDSYRVLEVGPDAITLLSDLTIRNGETVAETSFARGIPLEPRDGFGGGIHNRGILVLEDVSVVDNTAIGDSFGSVAGGGIYNEGTLELVGSDVTNNVVDIPTGDVSFISEAIGGGIATQFGDTFLTSSRIVNNRAFGPSGGDAAGGGVYQLGGFLSIRDSEIIDNQTNGSAGGLYVDVRSDAARVEGSTFAGNSAGRDGGGLMVTGTGVLQLFNSTVSSNVAINGAGLLNRSSMEVNHATVTANTAQDGAAVASTGNGVISIQNSIVAANGDAADVTGIVQSLGHNLIGNFFGGSDDASLGFATSKNDILPVEFPLDPRLGPLADNGGPTRTHGLLEDSLALDAGTADTTTVFSVDQRGSDRPVDGDGDGIALPDIGSVETGELTVVIDNDLSVGVSGQFAVEVYGGAASFPDGGQISANGRTRAIVGEQAIEAYRYFVRVGDQFSELDVATDLLDVTLNGPALDGDDTVVSSGQFVGPNGDVSWTATSRFQDGSQVFETQIRLEIAGESTLGDVELISFLDDRIDNSSPQLLFVTPGNVGSDAVRIDADQRIGLIHRVSELSGASYDGFVASDASLLLDAIESTAAFDTTGVVGGTPLDDLELGPVTEFSDLATVQRVIIEPEASSASLTFDIELVADAPTNLRGVSEIDGAPQSGAIIGLDLDSDGSVDRTTTTDLEGRYEFPLVSPGTHLVIRDLSSDFISIDPPFDVSKSITVGEVPADVSVDFAATVPGAIEAMVFEDLDADGIFVAGVDMEVAGVEVSLEGVDLLGQTIAISQTSADNGEVIFDRLLANQPGSEYRVSVTFPAEFVSTTAVESAFALQPGQLVRLPANQDQPVGDFETVVDVGDQFVFGATVPGEIRVFKFEDVDGDGLFSADFDRPMGEIDFSVEGIDGLGASVLRDGRTNETGQLAFEGLIPSVNGQGSGTGYTVTELLDAAYIPTTATTALVDVESRETVGDDRLIFGNARPAEIRVFKFEDVDGDGLFTLGVDGPLAGVPFELTGTDGLGNLVSRMEVTDERGQIVFDGLAPSIAGRGAGTGYTVAETLSSDLIPTTGTSVLVDVESGAILGNDQLIFGSARPSQVEAFKFEDVDGDGFYSSSIDVPLAGVEIRITGIDGLGATVDLMQLTDAQGFAQFEGLLPSLTGVGQGTGYTIEETVPQGFVPTTSVSNPFDLASGVRLYGSAGMPIGDDLLSEVFAPDVVDFANAVLGEIRLFAFEDVDGDGSFIATIDTPLPDVEFALSGTDGLGNQYDLTLVSDASGFVRFDSLLPSVTSTSLGTGYQIKALLPTDFEATTELSFDVELLSRQVLRPSNDLAGVEPEQVAVTLDGSLQVGGTVLGVISGIKFDDRDGDGIFDADHDVPIVGASFTLRGVTGDGQTIDETTTTDSLGRFVFDGLHPSVANSGQATGYQVSHVLPSGHRSMTHTADENGVVSVDVDLRSRDVIAEKDGLALSGVALADELLDDRLRFGSDFAQFTGALAGFVASGDVNGDGLDDMIVANDYSNPVQFTSSVSLLLATGDGGFSPPMDVDLPEHARPQSVEIVDLDGDGRFDVVAVAAIGDPVQSADPINEIIVLRATGDDDAPLVRDEMRTAEALACSPPSTDMALRCDGPIDLVVDDFDQDGRFDWAIASFRSDTVTIVLDAFGSPSVTHLAAGRAPIALESADLNADSNPDLIVANHDAGNLMVMLGNGSGGFIQHDVLEVPFPTAMVLDDFTGDGQADLAITSYDLVDNGSEGRVSRFTADGRGGFSFSDQVTVGEGANSIKAADLNGIGAAELIVIAADIGEVQIVSGDGDGPLAVISRFSVAAIHEVAASPSPQVVAVGDFDGVGHADFAVAHFTQGVTAYFNGIPVEQQRLRLASEDLGTQIDLRNLDVNQDGRVTLSDALRLINQLNAQDATSSVCVDDCWDVNGDGHLTPFDVLAVVNFLNANSAAASIVVDLPVEVAAETAEIAIEAWLSNGLPSAAAASLHDLRYEVRDLPNDELSLTYGSTVILDADAAGRGWYVATTDGAGDDLHFDGVDLLTVVLHEMGHVLGLGHDDDDDGLMSDVLAAGERRSVADAVDHLFADEH